MLNRIEKVLPAVVFHFLLIVTPLIFTASTDELFEFPKMVLVYGGAIILGTSWLIRGVKARKFDIPRTPFDLPILAFVVSQFASTVFSMNTHTSLFGYYSRYNGGLLSVFSYVILFYAGVLWISKENVRLYIRSMLIGAFLAALYAFPEHFGHSPSCYLITGKFTADCWIQDVQTRVFGTLGQPNWLAALMVVVLPFTLAKMVQTAKTTRQKILSYGVWPAVFLLFSLVLLYTKSRSGILGAGVSLGLFTTLSFFLSFTATHTFSYKKSFLPLAATFVFLVLIVSIANPVRDKLEQVIHLPTLTQSSSSEAPAPQVGTQLDSGGSESGDIRKVVWNGAIKVWLRYPIFGSGVETFAYSYYKDRPREHNLLSEWDFLYNKAHNEFLNYLATTGAVGLLTYVVLIGSFIVLPLVWIRKQHESINEERKRSRGVFFEVEGESPPISIPLLLATSTSIVGLSVSNFFGFSTVVVSLLTFVIPAFAVVTARRQRIISIDAVRFIKTKRMQQAALVIVWLIGGYFLLGTYRLYSVDVLYAKGKAYIDQQQIQEGVALLQSVVDVSPYEPVYRDELAYTAARLSYALGTSGDSTNAAKLAQAAIDHSDVVIEQNNANVNFYKTRVRIFSLLGQISPVFYTEAITTLLKARELSPTDPKLAYNLALVYKVQGKNAEYEQYLKETIALRPIDLQARIDLATFYEEQKNTDEALKQYQEMVKLDPTNTEVTNKIASLSASPKKK